MDRNRSGSFFRRHGMFISLLLIGLIFRFLFMYYQGLSNDELSAWKRTELPDWNSFWQLGVKTGDMHPVFYQALLWFWVRIFGDSELALRSTSLLFYLLNSWLIYRISIRFFSKQVGLMVIAVYAGLAFTVIHTVFARPYNSGTFFLLLLVWSIFELNRSERKFSGWHLGIVLGLIGAMLSHYYAFLTAGVIGLLALFYLNRKRIPGLIACGIAAILLFLPHWPVTKFQLSQGGLGWLPPPKWNWLVDFSHQFFNHSWLLCSFFIALFMLSLSRGAFYKSPEEKFALRIFLLTYITGHSVSVFYTPVLRELVMLYTLPFLFLFGFRGFQFSNGTKFYRWLIILPLAVGMHSIFRAHLLGPKNFGVFREIGKTVNKEAPKLGIKNMEFTSNFNNVSYINYYYDHDVSESIIDWTAPSVVYELSQRARNSAKEYFVYNWSNSFHMPMYYEVIRRHFPHVFQHSDYFNSASTIFSKHQDKPDAGLQKHAIRLKYENTFPSNIVSSAEFIGDIRINAKSLSCELKENQYILVEAPGKITGTSPVYLVVTLERDGKPLMNGGFPVLYAAFDQSQLVEKGAKTIFFNAFSIPAETADTDIIHIYLWNPEKQEIETGRPSVYKVGS